MDIQNAFQADVVEKIGDKEVKFPRLTMDDWAAWAATIKAGRIKQAEARLNREVDKKETITRMRVMRAVDNENIGLVEAMDEVYTPVGITKCLTISLKKAGLDDAAAVETLKQINPLRQARLALDVASFEMASPTPLPDTQDKTTGTFGSEAPTSPLAELPPPTFGG